MHGPVHSPVHIPVMPARNFSLRALFHKVSAPAPALRRRKGSEGEEAVRAAGAGAGMREIMRTGEAR